MWYFILVFQIYTLDLVQSPDCLSASEVSLKDMGKTDM